jgi:hypothetical protein
MPPPLTDKQKNDIIAKMISSSEGRANLANAMTQPLRYPLPDQLFWCPKCGWFWVGTLGVDFCGECSTRKNKVQLNVQSIPPGRQVLIWREECLT